MLKELLESGIIKPVIDRRYPLSEMPEAICYVEEGHAKEKVVIAVGQDDREIYGPGLDTQPKIHGGK